MLYTNLLIKFFATITVVGSGLVGTFFSVNKSLSAKTNVVFSTKSTDIFSENLKKYKCEISSDSEIKKIDYFCRIFKLEKPIQENDLTYESIFDQKNLENTKLQANKKYVVQINNNLFESVTGKNKQIKLLSFNDQTIHTFNTKVLLDKNFFDKKTSLVVAKTFDVVDKKQEKINGKKYYCRVAESIIADKFSCNLYKTAKVKTENTFIESKFVDLTKINSSQEIIANNYLLIEFKKMSIPISELENKKIELFAIEKINPEHEIKIATFSYSQSLVGDVSNLENNFAISMSSLPDTYILFLTSDQRKEIVQKTNNSKPELITNKQNYKCKFSKFNESDVGCELFAFPKTQRPKNTIVNENLNSGKKLLSKHSQLLSQNFYQLNIKKENTPSFVWNPNENQTIELISTENQETNYGTFQIIGKKINGKIVGKTSFVVGQISIVETISKNSLQLECSIRTIDKKSPCDIYYFETFKRASHQSHLFFGSAKKAKNTQKISSDVHFFLDLKKNKVDLLKNQEMIVDVFEKATNKKYFFMWKILPFIAEINTNPESVKALFLNS